MKKSFGFTLIELMVVIAIIGILASIAMPSYQDYVRRSEVVEALSMASGVKNEITDYYEEKLAFPKDNLETGIPEPDKMISNRITGVVVEDGAIHITLGNKVGQALQGQVLTFRPATVDGSPESPISWLCGFDKPVKGMTAVGENKTTLSNIHLPASCRK